MTQPNDDRRQQGQTGRSAQGILRRQLLFGAHGNCLPMAHVAGVISRENLADSLTAQQDLARRVAPGDRTPGLPQNGA